MFQVAHGLLGFIHCHSQLSHCIVKCLIHEFLSIDIADPCNKSRDYCMYIYIYIYIYTRFQKGFHIEGYIDRYILFVFLHVRPCAFSLVIVQLVKNLGSTIKVLCSNLSKKN